MSVIVHIVRFDNILKKQDARMADLASDPEPKGDTPKDTGGTPYQGSTATTPQWVKVFGTVMGALVLLFVALHLSGHGLRGHATLPSAGQQQP